MKSRKNMSGKGYYIALILCAAAIGISGYMYYQNQHDSDTQLQDPSQNVDVISPSQDDMEAVATQPGGSTLPDSSAPSTTPNGSKPMKTGWPVSGETIYNYAMESLSYNETTRDWRVHNGIDIAAEAGTAVCAAADGTVYTTYQDDTMGYTVVIRHQGGYVTVYSSLAEDISVSAGDTVKLGQTIGEVANTALLETALGDHLHFSVTCNDVPIDPAKFLEQN